MSQTLALLHTSCVLVPVFTRLCRQMLPEVAIFHMVDESLIKNTIARNGLDKRTIERVIMLLACARSGGADAVLVTCSSIGPAVPVARQVFDFPVLRVDEAMAEEAVRLGFRIGVLATLSTTLEPTVSLLREVAAARSRTIEVEPCLCGGAFDAVLAGDNDTHDRIVSEALLRMMPSVDVVVLAQASMARVIENLPRDLLTRPILSSPEPAVRQAREILCQPVATPGS
ncbi:MAG: aspartate/glutamate racemase family protein [Bryobacterales bacterium]|nr:aspartate/glutamate racemase family protein [Bryobacteraceae bacterium]MDW8129460.1 aspartate/glutamate racemase family protein [Bryobacterales bacterium]